MNSTAIENIFQEELYRIPVPVVIIIPRPWHKILEDEKTLLAKILGSVKLNIGSVAIMVREEVSPETIRNSNSEKLLVFGSKFLPDIKAYESVEIEGISVIRADDLGQLDEGRKKQLWVGLKQMFGV